MRLLSDADAHVVEAAAQAPTLPVAVMRAVIDHADTAGGPPPACACGGVS
ncbi:hypothetical protein ABZ128_09140 [Streptomyces sp. NPDC006326]